MLAQLAQPQLVRGVHSGAVGIDLLWHDDSGTVLDECGDPESHIAEVVEHARRSRQQHSVLASIDPFGTTRFAPPQITRLLREFEVVRAKVPVEKAITIGRFLTVLRAAEDAAGTWLEFVGD